MRESGTNKQITRIALVEKIKAKYPKDYPLRMVTFPSRGLVTNGENSVERMILDYYPNAIIYGLECNIANYKYINWHVNREPKLKRLKMFRTYDHKFFLNHMHIKYDAIFLDYYCQVNKDIYDFMVDLFNFICEDTIVAATFCLTKRISNKTFNKIVKMSSFNLDEGFVKMLRTDTREFVNITWGPSYPYSNNDVCPGSEKMMMYIWEIKHKENKKPKWLKAS